MSGLLALRGPRILELPPEILTYIASFLIPSRSDQDSRSYYNSSHLLMALALVCRYFSSIALPLLYSQINVEATYRNVKLAKLCFTLQRNPSPVAQYCREFNLALCGAENRAEWDRSFSRLNKLVSHLQNVRSLSINGNLSEAMWSLLQNALRHISDLESLDIYAGMRGIHFRDLVECIESIPSLQSLAISSIDLSGIEQSTGNPIPVPEASNPRAKDRTGQFTSLQLPYFGITLEETQRLIRWPKTLHHFRSRSWHLDFPILVSGLLTHKETLQFIDVNFTATDKTKAPLELTKFNELKTVSLSWCNVPQLRNATERQNLLLSPEEADLLLAPNLHTFEIRIRYERWNDFQETVQQWVQQLVNAAVIRKAALRVINITECDPTYHTMPDQRDDPNLWDWLDEIKRDVEREGLILVFDDLRGFLSRWKECRRMNIEAARLADAERREVAMDDKVQSGFGGDTQHRKIWGSVRRACSAMRIPKLQNKLTIRLKEKRTLPSVSQVAGA
ncbi:uncharacterized protein BJX67DRAFT_385644 [Aspergillus lucknowensis]|uniref:F-box domain-containing protein n=1 Tax=Aspergillus lucknowensis TaxID=176173 RepID=A0ABR4LG10_9EURO